MARHRSMSSGVLSLLTMVMTTSGTCPVARRVKSSISSQACSPWPGRVTATYSSTVEPLRETETVSIRPVISGVISRPLMWLPWPLVLMRMGSLTPCSFSRSTVQAMSSQRKVGSPKPQNTSSRYWERSRRAKSARISS